MERWILLCLLVVAVNSVAARRGVSSINNNVVAEVSGDGEMPMNMQGGDDDMIDGDVNDFFIEGSGSPDTEEKQPDFEKVEGSGYDEHHGEFLKMSCGRTSCWCEKDGEKIDESEVFAAEVDCKIYEQILLKTSTTAIVNTERSMSTVGSTAMTEAGEPHVIPEVTEEADEWTFVEEENEPPKIEEPQPPKIEEPQPPVRLLTSSPKPQPKPSTTIDNKVPEPTNPPKTLYNEDEEVLTNEIGGADNQVNKEAINPAVGASSSGLFITHPGILAAIIGGGVVGLLCAILLVMFIVYRMRKKDEGSYPLHDSKPLKNYAYAKAPSREFYA